MTGEGRRVVITGTSKGIGLASAVEVARAGFEVVGTVRDSGGAAALRAAAREAGVSIRVAELEVTDEAACRSLIEAETPWGLVNNAGYAQSGSVVDVTDDEAREQLEILVLGPARLGRLAAEHMCKQGSGRIVNVSSIVAEVSSPLLGWYQAAKNALEGISDAMRMELRDDGIDVVLVQPGVIRTDIWRETRERLDRPSRFTSPYEAWKQITRAVEPFMSSPEAVGTTIRDVLLAERPRSRYPVGLDAQVLTRVGKVLPTSVADAITRSLFNLR